MKTFFLAFLLSLAWAPLASASDDDVLQLSRVTVHESDWDSPADQEAIFAVLKSTAKRMGGVSIARAAREYSPRATGFEAPRTERNLWVSGLNLDGTEPEGWPTERVGDWRGFRSRWLAVIARSRALLASYRPGPCDADDWGSVADGNRWNRIPVDCGKTRNLFYRRR